MKKLMIALFAVAALCSCKGVNFNITGTAAQNEAGALYLMSAFGDEDKTIATAEIDPQTGVFEFKGTVDEPTLAMITDDNETPMVALFIEPGDVKILFSEQTQSYDATGTPANDNFKAVNEKLQDIQTRYAAVMQQGGGAIPRQALIDEYNTVVRTAIDENKDNILGAYLFRIESAELEPAELRARLEEFPLHLRKTKMLKQVEAQLEAQERTAEGSPYIEIVAKNTADEEVALSSLVGEGKWVLIDFWATWCAPCRGEIPYLAKAYKKYADKGFEIYGVSLDREVEVWKEYVGVNEMNWVNVIGINDANETPSADAYGVRSIPSNFLISPEGKIVAKNLRGEGVEAKLAELLGE